MNETIKSLEESNMILTKKLQSYKKELKDTRQKLKKQPEQGERR